MTNMEMDDSSHKFGHDWLQTVKNTQKKSLFLQLVETRDVFVYALSAVLALCLLVLLWFWLGFFFP